MPNDPIVYIQAIGAVIAFLTLWHFRYRLEREHVMYKTPLPRLCHTVAYVRAYKEADYLIKIRRVAGTLVTFAAGFSMVIWMMAFDNFHPISLGLFYAAGFIMVSRIFLGLAYDAKNSTARGTTRWYLARRYADVIHPQAWENPEAAAAGQLPLQVGGSAFTPLLKVNLSSSLSTRSEFVEEAQASELEPALALKRALASCKSGSPPEVGTAVLVASKDAARVLHVYTALVTAVEPCQIVGTPSVGVRLFATMADGVLPPWTITAAGTQFVGARMAVAFADSDQTGEMIEWMATPDTVHVLLASIYGLSDLDRDAINELINPGVPLREI